ncbi:DUF4426 domain-containing protein [Cognatilysobacter terrigena]|uniref:DUF4426 domain-containing protein n=1 Tax=Cognatilysobacter terrigena TaxID=2488749 RepID=UPI00105FB9A6|nr:DUF4426 domain-containing protein [Lysobacter terrigena]
MRTVVLALALALLAGCGRDAPPITASAASSTQQAQARIGDVVVHASVVQTSTLDEAVAREYGLERSDRTAMLLISARNANGDAPPSAVDITATVAPVNGVPQPIALREVHVGDLVDHVGTVDIAPPETLKFDVTLRYGSATSSMQFTRDFFPR